MDVQFHLDESVASAVGNGLWLRGIGVTTSKDAGLIGASDAEQLVYALSQDRVLVTHDEDFLRLHAAGAAHAGIAYRHPRRSSVGPLVHALVHLWRTRSREEMRGRVEFV